MLDRDTFVLNNSILLFGRTNYGTHAPVATYPTELLTRHVLTRCKVKKLKRADFDPPLTRVHSCLPPTGSSRRMKEPCALHCYMRLEVGPVQLGKPPVRILSRFGKQTREVQKHVGSSDALIAHSLFSADARREGANGAARLSTDGRCTTVKGRPTPKRVSPD